MFSPTIDIKTQNDRIYQNSVSHLGHFVPQRKLCRHFWLSHWSRGWYWQTLRGNQRGRKISYSVQESLPQEVSSPRYQQCWGRETLHLPPRTPGSHLHFIIPAIFMYHHFNQDLGNKYCNINIAFRGSVRKRDQMQVLTLLPITWTPWGSDLPS